MAEFSSITNDLAHKAREAMYEDNPLQLHQDIQQLWWHWADFTLHILSPIIDVITPPLVIYPEVRSTSQEQEFVYRINDYGNRLMTSKAEDMFEAGMSMAKLYNTIEKMIALLVERLKSGGVEEEEEVRVAFDGHLLCQRKAFESIINLTHNVIVINFEPGDWGELYLQNIKRIADRGYGYPPLAPRTTLLEKYTPKLGR
ncbi:MAG: virulence factor [Legionellaceae bacterium]|nr:virulence factor [Legionellaceae bacterium]HAF87995.1 virulence factor [Legionellales bacterium]HCA90117.1 virulence factor [Legionellales bacterium]|tara:strand:+ start:1098 stop:1697 length:600 start_codon:yes stop_codon:yes gene_type:complete